MSSKKTGIEKPSLGTLFKDVFLQALNFEGYERRREYNLKIIISWGLTIIWLISAYILGYFLLPFVEAGQAISTTMALSFFNVVFALIWLAYLFSNAALMVRRLHDSGLSGLYIFTFIIPLVGIFLLFYLCFRPSQKENNRYKTKPAYAYYEDEDREWFKHAYGQSTIYSFHGEHHKRK
ncbi:hypothetical protein CKF54_07215 [Psittacicella hinzii]|uniref:DUF805 domain-containing protein n=1 Tax=Psittacicella hinzii TaxID=2028575 RepID=A0A3A1Y1V9_9GAMM|nr:DUF805 domain-containing protein [Psittacicella hinzii]RIY31208.1 hypothetical protein CKF54_07215 [Psittacicella hinzii]